MPDKYYLSAKLGQETIEREVTLEQYCNAERMAGFRPKLYSGDPAYMTTPATGAFSSGNQSGRISYVETTLPETAPAAQGLSELQRAVNFLDQVRSSKEETTATGAMKDAHEWVESAARATIAAVQPLKGAVPWRCFHCDEVFTDREQARLHFGASEYQSALCTIDPAHFRWMEEQHRRNCADDSEALRTISSLVGEHERLRRRAEELGYARGLEDAKRHPGDLGLQVIPTKENNDV